MVGDRPVGGERETLGLVRHPGLVDLAGVVVVGIARRVGVAVAGAVDAAIGHLVDQRSVRPQPAVALVGVGVDEQREALRWRPAHAHPGGDLLELADLDVGVRQIDELAQPVAPGVGAGGGDRPVVGQALIRVEVSSPAPARAGFEREPAGLFASRRPGDDVDRTADRVAAVESALRPAQHFDALDVRQVPVLSDLAPEVDAVDVDADAGVGGDEVILQADAADERVGGGGVAGREAGHVQVRDELADVDQVGDALPLKLLAGEGGDRDRHLVDALLALLGGNGDLLEHLLGFNFLLALDGGGLVRGLLGGGRLLLLCPGGRYDTNREQRGGAGGGKQVFPDHALSSSAIDEKSAQSVATRTVAPAADWMIPVRRSFGERCRSRVPPCDCAANWAECTPCRQPAERSPTAPPGSSA